ncbi:MAG: hypothetical protein AB3N14_05285 [Flavobacteriaceae bacterium]
MNTKKIFFGICACLFLMAAACTPSADDQVYEEGVDKTKIVNGDIKNVDKSKLVNGDTRSVDKSILVNGDRR